MQQLSLHLAENLAELDARFGASADYYAKEIMIYHCRGCIVLFDGMASLDSLWELLLDAASRQALQQPCPCTGQEVYERILHGSASLAESTPVEDLPDLVKRLTAGMAVLLLDGCAKGIAFSVQALKYRSVDEPEGEGNLRGSREGFADLLRVNLSLLRRLVRTDDLVLEVAQADTAAGTEYAICYCRGKADPAMVRQVRQTLAAAKPELLLDSSYFVPWLLPSRARLFTPVSYTQRPAAASAKLCEGRIVVLVNGSPSAMVLPALFCENFECLDDYASTAVFASFLRVLNYASFYLTVFLPGAFVCLAVYLPELIPPQLLYKIEAAEKATPLPLFAEMLLVILLLEVIREAGLRMPQSLGHSVSLVAALILGDAAIATGLMSTPVIFVASITSIAVFVTPALYEPATLLRIGVVVAAGLAGPVGLAGAFFVLLLSLSGTGMLGVPYLAQHPFPQSPLAEDGVIRRNYRHLSRKGFNIESLAVGPTEERGLSRLTLEVLTDDQQTELLCNQLSKMVPVHSVRLLAEEHSIRREMVLCKVRAEERSVRSELIQLANVFRASILDVSSISMTLAVIGEESKNEALTDLLREFGILEMVRTGMVALERGRYTIQDERKETLEFNLGKML